MMTKPELLPPEDTPSMSQPHELKLRQLPLALAYLGGAVGMLGILIVGGLLLEFAGAILVFILIAFLLLIGFPVLFLAAYSRRKRRLVKRHV